MVIKLKVVVKYFGYIKNLLGTGKDTFELSEGASISDLMKHLIEKYNESFKKEVYEAGMEDLKTGFVLTVNGTLMGQLDGIKTELHEGDEITLMSLATGGWKTLF